MASSRPWLATKHWIAATHGTAVVATYGLLAATTGGGAPQRMPAARGVATTQKVLETHGNATTHKIVGCCSCADLATPDAYATGHAYNADDHS